VSANAATTSSGEPTILAVHYFHDHIAVSARFCHSLEGARDRVGSSKLAYILAMGFNEPLDEGAMCREQLVKDWAVLR
jgi:hypothetical protein